MKFHFHNKLLISNGNKEFSFYNTMLNSVYNCLKNLQPYFKYVSIGTGEALNSEQNSFHLGNHLKTYQIETDYLQDKLNDNVIYAKKTLVIEDNDLNNIYIKEIGLSNNEDDKILYNYFSLIGEDTPNGIQKEINKPLIISIIIYLEIEELNSFILTDGNNKFIDFLLGEGIDGKIYVSRGNNTSPNKRIYRETPTETKFECELEINQSESSLTLNFFADIGTGETNEIVFLIDSSPFARINLQEFKPLTSSTETFTPKTHYVIDLSENVKSFDSVINLTTNAEETDIYSSNYATDFADKITLPFYNMFTSTTARFLSKDGDKIFFVIDDSIYAYKNSEFQINQIETGGINIQNISKIVSFDDYVFIFTKLKPFIYSYKIVNNRLESVDFDLSSCDKFDEFENLFDVDITLAKNGLFMLGAIIKPDNYGYAIFFTYDSTENKFIYDSYQSAEYCFSYILAMFKNNFSDAMLFFIREGDNPVACRLVTFTSEKEKTDVFTNLAYLFAYQTKEIYTKNRAIIVEKTTEPYMWIYYYPQVYRYNLPLLSGEEDDYVSTNLIYLIQKYSEGDYKIYNLVGYNTPTEFSNGFPSEIDQTKIQDFEFLNDTLLIFMDSDTEPIVAYNFKENCMLIENVSTNEDEYEIKLNRYNLLGSNNEGVVAKFTATIVI